MRNVLPFLSTGVLIAAPVLSLADPSALVRPPLPDASRLAAPPQIAVPLPEREGAGLSTVSPFASSRAVAPNAQSLSAPVTVNANTSADALTATQTGGGRAISGVINNTGSTISALKGTTNGGGAALAGQNTGTSGSAGQFQNTNASNTQPGITVSTVGTNSAIQAVQGNTGNYDAPAVYGQHTSGPSYYGIGVEGDGNYIGVKGIGNGSGFGVYGSSGAGYGVYGSTSSGFAVYGGSNSGYGVVGASNSGYAGYFYGPVLSTGLMTAQSYATSSDRNVKEAIEPIDTESVLDRVAAMPISSWDFQTQPGVHHIGPMAQDFRAAFGLGADDKHIDLVDGVGVSLAAIQELQRQVKAKDALSAEQQTRLAQQQSRIGEQQARIDALDARLEALEQRSAGATVTSIQP